ncbi:MAG: hypothetical protein QM770_17035 [Tepidisphaeraceae bacterium]
MAALVISDSSLSYSQNFDTLTQSGTAQAWTDDVATDGAAGLKGWYVGYSSNSTRNIQGSGGGTATGTIYSFGASSSVNGVGDRALGSVASGTPGNITYAMRFVNNSVTNVTGFTLNYDGEQWRVADKTGASGATGNALNENLVPGYAVFNAGAGAPGVTGTYTAAPGASQFNTPIDGATPAASLDGNLAANRVAGFSWTVTGLSVAPNQELWIRFFDSDSAGSDHGLSVDNVSVSFTLLPEPSTVLGGLALGALALRRRA